MDEDQKCVEARYQKKKTEKELHLALEKIITHKVTGKMADVFHKTDNEQSNEERDSDNEQSNEATNDHVSKRNGPDEIAVVEKKKRKAAKRKAGNDKTSENTLCKTLKTSKKPHGKHTSSPKKNCHLDSRIIMTQIIEKEQEHDKDFGACFSFRVKDEFNMNWLN